MTCLRNETLTVEVAKHGAELESIIDNRSGIEYLWQADPAYWGRSAPILFPIVGRLKDDMYTVDAVTYSLPQHGFARDSVFRVVEKQDSLVVLELNADAETRKAYPYDFRLRVSYRLSENRIEITYSVANQDNGPMNFSIGSHPAFNIPFGSGEYTDYFIEFEEKETLACYGVEDGLVSADPPRVMTDNKTIQLTKTLFDAGALVFKGLHSNTVFLGNRLDEKRVAVSTGGAPYLGIWSKPQAPYVCIEPWFGIADSTDTDVSHDFSSKEGIRSLLPGETFETTYSISIRAD
ncbi:MAG: aldose 1-epimerase family protein [Deltaproteobacteria bacterium]|nr:aldose 1-epimerase family protein [Deltaproteobacteria bacterium]